MSDRLHRYTITIEHNTDTAYHPVSVIIERLGETKEFHGKALRPLLMYAVAAIVDEEKE